MLSPSSSKTDCEKTPVASAFKSVSLTVTSALGTVLPVITMFGDVTVDPFCGEVMVRGISPATVGVGTSDTWAAIFAVADWTAVGEIEAALLVELYMLPADLFLWVIINPPMTIMHNKTRTDNFIGKLENDVDFLVGPSKGGIEVTGGGVGGVALGGGCMSSGKGELFVSILSS
jgi:hypothetical protein